VRRYLKELGEFKVEFLEEIKVKGKLDGAEGARLEQMLEGIEYPPDKVIFGGPGNSLMAHEGGVVKGKGVKREVEGEGGVRGMRSRYHLIETSKLRMCERKQVASVVARLVSKCKELWPLTEVLYLGMFPRHVEQCCNFCNHMSDMDCQVINQSRIDLEEDVEEEIRRTGEQVLKVDWWEFANLGGEPKVD